MMDEAAAKGYIRGYETLIDWEQAGVNLVEAVIELRVTPHKARGFDDIGITLSRNKQAIEEYEAKRMAEKPWLAPPHQQTEA